MPMPSPLRALACLLGAVLVSIALYACIQGAVMLYDMYQLIDWIEEVVHARP